jgi:cytochrome P450
MLSLDGDEHARHRGAFAGAFRHGRVRGRLAGFVEAEVDQLISGLRGAGAAELRGEFAGPLAVSVVAEALGLGAVDAGTVLSWYAAIVRAVSEVTAGRPAGAAGVAAVGELRTRVERAIGADSVLGEAARELGVDGVVSNAAVVMFGGIDTTEGMIVNAVRHLLGDRSAVAAVRGGAPLGNAIDESVRLEPAAAVLDRYATRDVELGGASIRRGDLVIVSIAGANRDPAVFAGPDRFEVHRANARLHLGFAQGPHFCLGAALARTETEVAIRQLLVRLPGLRLDPDRPSAPRGLVFRKPPALYVRWD